MINIMFAGDVQPFFALKNKFAGMGDFKLRIEDLLPHRGRMKLIDELIELDEEKALTGATVAESWPFYDGGAVSSLVLVELVAQTAGTSNCWCGIKKHGKEFQTRGWLVGIKQSRFYMDRVALNTRLITRSKNQFKLDNYIEVTGTVAADSKIIAEVTLQLVQPD